MYKLYLKRLIDIILSTIILLITFPIFIVLYFVLYFINDTEPFFYQLRPGKNEKIFKVIKFKTMNNRKDVNGNLLSDDHRLTTFGKILRKSSLDELPQLINVIKGDMSLVGPRPLLVRYLDYYKENEKIRHRVRPGITGWAQVNGRNTLDWDTRLNYDIYYVKNLSFFLDCKVLYKTMLNVLSSKDVVVNTQSVLKDLDEERKN